VRITKTLCNCARNMSNYSHNISQPDREYDPYGFGALLVVSGLNLKLVMEGLGVMEV
jgi:hypothetical protein